MTHKEVNNDGYICLKVENGALQKVPFWHLRTKATNWLAKINGFNPKLAAGLVRDFIARGRGEGNYYLIENLQLGDVIEFGYNYFNKRGRLYAVVININTNCMTIYECKTAKEAFDYCQTELTSCRKEFLKKEVCELKERLRQVENELQSIL